MKKILIILTLIYFSACATMCESEDIPKDLNDCDVREVHDPNNSCCYVEFDDQKFCKEAKDTESIPTPEGVQRRVVGCHRKKKYKHWWQLFKSWIIFNNIFSIVLKLIKNIYLISI